MLASKPPAPDALREDYSVQAAADARRGPVPPVVAEHAGAATLETFTVVYERDGHQLVEPGQQRGVAQHGGGHGRVRRG